MERIAVPIFIATVEGFLLLGAGRVSCGKRSFNFRFENLLQGLAFGHALTTRQEEKNVWSWVNRGHDNPYSGISSNFPTWRGSVSSQ